MEKRIKRIEVLLIITLIVSIIGLFQISFPDLFQSSPQEEASEPEKELPADLTKQRLDEIAYRIKINYNRSDWLAIYDIFGELAKAQIDVEDIENGFIKLKSATGAIQTYAYSHPLYGGNSENADWFDVFYKCRFDNGKGTIKISIRIANDSAEVTGINITLDEL